MFLPQTIALMIELKLSSRRTISQASLATYVPAIPMANPTSAFFKAGASLVPKIIKKPSPVTATTFPRSISPVTKAYLSSGLDLESTSSLSIIRSNSSPLAIVSLRIFIKKKPPF
jgi:hypothetical protein